MDYKKPYIIAEAGCNHMGQMEIAHEMITTASIFCKANAIKFQKRCPKELLTPEQYNAPHPNPANSYGKTYGEHREFLEFDIEQHAQLKKWCEEVGITYSSSVWDMTSAREISSLNPKFIKIPSACNNHFEMLDWLCNNYEGEIQLSFGMTTHEEEEQIVQLFERNNRAKDLGIAVDVAAYTLGASYIERHYTLDRTWKGTDHAASLEPDGIRRVVRDCNALYEALRYKESEILPIEQVQREKLKYRKR